MLKKFTKKEILHTIWKIFLVILGTLVLSFGSGVFLVPFEIVSGGVTGIGILFADFISVDITAAIITWGLFFVGLIFLGLKFSLTTLISTIVYPIALSIILRTGIAESIVSLLLNNNSGVLDGSGVIKDTIINNIDSGLLLVCGIVGGALVGIGCSLTFIGGGSTGGLDILTFVINKFTGIKQSVLFFAIDGIIVLIGLVVDITKGDSIKFIAGLIGIISAFVCSFMVEVVYVSKEGAYNVDIISDKYDEFVEYSIKELDRSATIFDIVGGYSKEGKKMIRITFNRREYMKVKDAIAKIDSNAFCTFSQTMLVGGLGFSRIQESSTNSIKSLQKAIKKRKKDE